VSIWWREGIILHLQVDLLEEALVEVELFVLGGVEGFQGWLDRGEQDVRSPLW